MSDDKKPERDVSQTVDRIGRSAWGLGTRLFGPKVIPPPVGEQEPMSHETELAIDAAGATIGRWLHAAGRAIEAHPMDPAAAVNEARQRIDEVPEPAEGETPLTAGARDLGGGLYKLAEGVLDVVAPRRAKAHGDNAAGGDAAADAAQEDAAEDEVAEETSAADEAVAEETSGDPKDRSR